MKIRNLSRILLVCLTLSAGGASAQDIIRCDADANVPQAVAEGLDALLMGIPYNPNEANVSAGHAPGGVLYINAADWRYARAIGVADIEAGTPISCETPFQIGSNTKMMTATVLLQLVKEGMLTLDDKLSAHLPGIAAELPYGADITLLQLANHTSGVFSYTDNAPDGTPGIMEGDLADPDALRRSYAPSELIKFTVQHGTPSFAPGAKGEWAYSNTGFILLGMIIEAADKRPLAESFKARIFDPLGMKDTFLWNDVPKVDFGLPDAYLQAPFEVEMSDWNMSQAWAAGAVISKADDMRIFVEALLAGKLFKSADTLNEMQNTVPTTNFTLHGYGTGLADKGSGAWGHGGQTLGFQSDIAQFVDADISLVGWGSSSSNIMRLGTLAVAGVLVKAGVLPDPNAEKSDALRRQLTANEWQLVAIEGGDGTKSEPADPSVLTATFNGDGALQVQADCNRVLGKWTLDKLIVKITLGPTTMALCPPGSFGNDLREWMSGVTGAIITEEGLLLITTLNSKSALLHFRAAE